METALETALETPMAGGSWQAFMAWVPNASAMQIAEPWKPLPPPEEEKKGRHRSPRGIVIYGDL